MLYVFKVPMCVSSCKRAKWAKRMLCFFIPKIILRVLLCLFILDVEVILTQKYNIFSILYAMPSKGVNKLMITYCFNSKVSGITDFSGVILSLEELMQNRAEIPFVIFLSIRLLSSM